ncbi:hypothetical protein pipiens_013188 [Culex pipiens pipiens]|uniref:Cytochrome P450 n=1 Tax=Culex pipiens pipiens TaxID=38569 RepID=A0ABD1D225_CULPP
MNFFIPSVLVTDPELVKGVLVRNFDVFHDRGLFVDTESDPISGSLFSLEGSHWRAMRQKLSPAFTSGKMKHMFGLMVDVAEQMRRFMDTNCHRADLLEMKDALQRYSIDVIGNVAFGIECNSMENPDSEFRQMGTKAFQFDTVQRLKFFFGGRYKALMKGLGLKVFPGDVSGFFRKLTASTVEYREKSGVRRNDFINLMLEIRNKNGEEGLTMDELSAQCFIFFTAGFETSSATMNFCLYELALNPVVQNRLRQEIEEVVGKDNDGFTYEKMLSMDYLDRVVKETLRKYPPAESLFRISAAPFAVPNTKYHYPQPDRFDPDRFLEEAVQKRHPYSYLPFGEGPRNCVGMRFGLMQVKVGLVMLLRNFSFAPNAHTPLKIEFDPEFVILAPTKAARNPQLLTGNVAGMVSTEHMATTLQRLYREFKQRGLTFGGFNNFFAPTILLVEPELVKHVMVKDFGVFHDRGLYVDPEGDPLSGNLFNLEGHQWKVMRQKLSPTFTSGKMKLMFDTVASVAKELNQFVDENCHREDMELREVLQRFTVDVIGNVAFGIDCNTMKNPDSDFRKMGNKAFALTTTSVIKSFIGIQFKSLAKFMKMKITEDDVEQFFMELTRSTVQMREQNGSQRNDFMKLLLEIRDQGTISDAPNSAGEGLTMRELAAQCFVFFLAGFETSSSTMTFCLYELALNPDVQYRLREEIKEALNEGGGHLTYEALMKMDYLDRVVSETLRKHPPLDNTFRTNEVDYVIPGTNYTIPAGTFVQIPIYAIQRDPDNFPEPDKFDPDRFLPEAVKSRHPYAYIPFGEGPRICIGMRFGLMQAKLGLATLLANFQFSTSPRTSVPLVYDPPSITLGPKGGMYLRIERVE